MHQLTKYLLFTYLALLMGLANADGDMRVTDAWSRATPPGAHMGAAYFVLTNRGAPDRLLSASAPVSERTELHITTKEDGLMKMRRVEAVELKHGEAVHFMPGGRHVMFIGLKQPLREGDTFPLTLTFEKAGSLEVTVHVRSAAGTPKSMH